MVSTGEPGKGQAEASPEAADLVGPLCAGLAIRSADTILFLPFCLAA